MFLILISFFFSSPFVYAQVNLQSIAAQYSLTTSTSLPFPTATQANTDTQSFLINNWGLSSGRIQNGENDLQFVEDPFSSNNTTPVLQVTYDAGSYSHNTGGAQLYSRWNSSDGAPYQSMMVSYDVAFDQGFNWVKGGKLPGLRGGPDNNGCSGGNQPNGSDCFSTRFMWRTNGVGEVYAYILRPDNLCGNVNVTCNSDYGISVQRGSFIFESGQWNNVVMFVQLNSPVNRANGNIIVYYNGVLVEQEVNLQFRNNKDINIGGFWLSTFFGGSDATWATPVTTHTYFRNVQLWAGNSASTLEGIAVSAGSQHFSFITWHLLLAVGIVMTASTRLRAIVYSP